MHIPPSQLPEQAAEVLRERLGTGRFSQSWSDRIAHSLGQSYPDLVRRRRGDFGHPPDAVAYPETADQVQAVLHLAAQEGISVIPYGGGTSVVGGVEAQRRSRRQSVVTLDLGGLNRVLHIDVDSHLARVQAGIRGPDLERALCRAGLTLGHYPQSFEFSTLGGWIAARSWGQCSTRYGSIADLVRGVRLLTPEGPIEVSPAPGRSIGPELQELVVGSEGTLGVITEATVEVHRRPESCVGEGFLFPSFSAGVRAVRLLMQADLRPAVCRLSDAEELRASQALSHPGKGLRWLDRLGRWWLRARGRLTPDSALLILTFEGARGEIAGAMRRARRIVRRCAGASIGSRPMRSWYENRFRLPYLRDALLDQGYLIETLETGVTWSRLESLYERGRQAISHALGSGLTLCHLSHPNAVGACLYFTALAPQESGHEIDQWRRLKSNATRVFLKAGGVLSHHHGVGSEHQAWMRQAVGPQGMRALAAVKSELDPEGIMNPGKLGLAGT